MQDEVGRAARALGVAREELRGSRSDLEKLAATDPLTGVSNRRHFEGELEKEVASDGAARAVQRPAGAGPGQLQVRQRQPRPRRRRLGSLSGRANCCARGCARLTSSHDSAATSSRCCCATSDRDRGSRDRAQPARRRYARRASRSRTDISCGSASASASPLSTATTTSARRSCWSTPTSPCTTPRRPGATGSRWPRPMCTRNASSPANPGSSASASPSSRTPWSCTRSRSCTSGADRSPRTSCCCGCAATPAS